ncbi:MAG: transposase [Sphingomonadales bacterium]|nr:transposase [Sphingomonadales bacterium]MDE2568458.1 transposase [Sphingomonadales bacterium]
METVGIGGLDAQTDAPAVRTTNWPENNAARKQRGSLAVWLGPEMEWVSLPSGRPGRSLRFSVGTIESCLTLKGLFQLPLRQVTGLGACLLGMAKLDWPVPDAVPIRSSRYTAMARHGSGWPWGSTPAPTRPSAPRRSIAK